jgi:hypothetical protein
MVDAGIHISWGAFDAYARMSARRGDAASLDNMIELVRTFACEKLGAEYYGFCFAAAPRDQCVFA